MEQKRIDEIRKRPNDFGNGYVVIELLDALETSEGVLKDTIEAMGHMQDEVERQAKEIVRKDEALRKISESVAGDSSGCYTYARLLCETRICATQALELPCTVE